MNYREMSQALGNPSGAYFQDGTPAMLALEVMIETAGLRNVLHALAYIAIDKSRYASNTLKNFELARQWAERSKVLQKASLQVRS